MGPSSILTSRYAAYVSCMLPSFVVGLTTVGVGAGGTGPWPGWLQGPALCSGCGPARIWARLPMWLVVQSGSMQLPWTCCHMEQDPYMASCIA